MSVLLETTLGDIVMDLDIEGSPLLCQNFLKLAKARYYTNTLIYNVQQGRFCQCGDPRGDGSGGSSIYGLIDTELQGVKDVAMSRKRFIKSDGRILRSLELQEKGKVVAVEMQGIENTIGSQFLITIDGGPGKALDGVSDRVLFEGNESNPFIRDSGKSHYFSIGDVVEDDNNILNKINEAFCDRDGRPHADIRIVRIYILDDPFDDPVGLDQVLKKRGVRLLDTTDLPERDSACARWLASASPNYERPAEERVQIRIKADQVVIMNDTKSDKFNEEEIKRKEARSRAVILEMVGDLPSADIKPPENVLFVCKLNPVTVDEDLELIFSRFDPDVRAEIIRDPDTGQSLQYAFIEFTTPKQCNEAYLKMNNALIDDRRIKVDFSQSVAKIWNKYAQKPRSRHQGPPGHSRLGRDINKQNNGRRDISLPTKSFPSENNSSQHKYNHQQEQEKERDRSNTTNRHSRRDYEEKHRERKRTRRSEERHRDRKKSDDESNVSRSKKHRKSHHKHRK